MAILPAVNLQSGVRGNSRLTVLRVYFPYGKRQRQTKIFQRTTMNPSTPASAAGAGRGAAMLDPLDLSKRFSELAGAWKKETRLLSSMTDMILHPAYQQIIGLGRGALPLILEELARQPD